MYIRENSFIESLLGSLSSITSTARKYLLKDVLNNMDKSLSKAINSKL